MIFCNPVIMYFSIIPSKIQKSMLKCKHDILKRHFLTKSHRNSQIALFNYKIHDFFVKRFFYNFLFTTICFTATN